MTTMKRLQIMVRAEKLPFAYQSSWMPIATKIPDAFCLVSDVTETGSVLGIRRHMLGQTEVVPQSASPEWATVVTLNHTPGTEHKISIDVFHCTGDADKVKPCKESGHRGMPVLKRADQLVGLLFDVETILSQRDQTLVERIPGSPGGRVIVRLEESVPGQGQFHFHLRAMDCHNTRRNFLDRPDFMYEIRRKQRGKTQDTWALVYRSKVAKSTLNPYWEQDSIDLETLCNHDLDREIQISIVDVENYTLLGFCLTNIHGLLGAQTTQGNGDTTKALDITMGVTHKTRVMGKLVVLHARVTSLVQDEPLPEAVAVQIMAPPAQSAPPTNYTFQDYTASGKCTLELCVAVDYTQTNGDYRLEGTPHYRTDDKRMNDYEWSMCVVAETIRKYNTETLYPMWGFGAVFQDRQHDIFQCGPTARAKATQGLLDAYRVTFQTGLKFGTRTEYGNVIQAAAHYSKKEMDDAQNKNALSYTVLLIITTGTQRDILAARERIEAVDGAPLSVVFLRIDNGRNDASFEKVQELMLDNSDIRCTFVDAREFTKERNARPLAEAVLESVKLQLADYFSSRGIHPA